MFDAHPALRETTIVYYVDDDHALTSESALTLLDKLAREFLLSERSDQSSGLGETSAAIEVEKKYAHSPLERESCMKSLEQICDSRVRLTMFDSYWDTEVNVLVQNDIWLRKRGGLWELKRPVQKVNDGTVYEEISQPSKIAEALNGILPIGMPRVASHRQLTNCLETICPNRFANIYTDRNRYIAFENAFL
jgi:hypothetical protein